MSLEKNLDNSSRHDTHSQRSRRVMLQLRSDPAFVERILASTHNPERGKKISESLRANTEAMARRRADVLRFQDEKPLPKVLKKILDLNLVEQHDLIAQAYSKLLSDPTRKELAEFITQGATSEAFGPLAQGFLLMTNAYDQLQSPVSPQASTIQTVHNTINDPETQKTIFRSLTKRKRVFHFAKEIAYMRFPPPTPDNPSAFVSQAVATQRESSRTYFLFGAALAYNLHLRMETMRCKSASRRNTST